MSDASGTLALMADKKKGGKKPRGPGRPATGRSPHVVLFSRVPPALGEALQQYVESREPKTTSSAVVELAVRRFLVSEGFYPPKKD